MGRLRVGRFQKLKESNRFEKFEVRGSRFDVGRWGHLKMRRFDRWQEFNWIGRWLGWRCVGRVVGR